jgi:hypothetical protein
MNAELSESCRMGLEKSLDPTRSTKRVSKVEKNSSNNGIGLWNKLIHVIVRSAGIGAPAQTVSRGTAKKLHAQEICLIVSLVRTEQKRQFAGGRWLSANALVQEKRDWAIW